MIEFDNVTTTYPGATAPAVESFSYAITGGATTVIVGPSGCGKTTLLRMINRMVDPSAGQVRIDGKDIAEEDAVHLRRSIGYVMQNSGLLPHKTALENVAAVARLSGASKAQARERAAQWLERVHLDAALFDRYPGELSGGQAQRVGVARGLVADPTIVLMDEPSALWIRWSGVSCSARSLSCSSGGARRSCWSPTISMRLFCLATISSCSANAPASSRPVLRMISSPTCQRGGSSFRRDGFPPAARGAPRWR